jgi:hypothetical protein
VPSFGLIWRSAIVAGYAVWALLWSLVLGGGAVILGFFAVWGGVWLGFSLFLRWAQRERSSLLKRRGYY